MGYRYPWVLASVAGKGKLHCEDAALHLNLDSHYSLIVVCDGAGSVAEGRRGANMLAKLIGDLYLKSWSVFKKQLVSVQSDLLSKDWRSIVTKLLIEAEAQLYTYAQDLGVGYAELASTMQLCLYSADQLFFAHIGDGRAAFATAPDSWQPIMKPFKGSEVNQTVFFTSVPIREMSEKMLHTSVFSGAYYALTLLTDGAERAAFEVNLWSKEEQRFYDPNIPFVPFFRPLTNGLVKMYEAGYSQEDMNGEWAAFLKSGNTALKEEPDDKTLFLVVFKEKLI